MMVGEGICNKFFTLRCIVGVPHYAELMITCLGVARLKGKDCRNPPPFEHEGRSSSHPVHDLDYMIF